MCGNRLEVLQREGFKGDLVTYNTLLKACMRAHDGRQAEAVHRAMMAAGIKGDEVTYNTLVKALAYAAEDARPAAASEVTPLLTAAGVAGPGASPWDLQKVHSRRCTVHDGGDRTQVRSLWAFALQLFAVMMRHKWRIQSGGMRCWAF